MTIQELKAVAVGEVTGIKSLETEYREQVEKAANNRALPQDHVGNLSGGPLSEAEKERVRALVDRVGPSVPTTDQQKADIGRAFVDAHQQAINDPSRRVEAGLQAAASEQRAQVFVGRLNGAELSEEQKQSMRALIDSVSQQREQSSEKGLEQYQSASADVVSFMDAKSADERAEIAARMQLKSHDPGYVESLQKMTPDLSDLAKEHTLEEREALFAKALEAQQERERNDPEIADELERMAASAKRDELIREAREAAAKDATNQALKQQELAIEEERRRERERAAQNEIDAPRERGVDPSALLGSLRIDRECTIVDGKYFAKKDNQLLFQEKGGKFSTVLNDQKTAALMVAEARRGLKEGEALKLSGSQEFRRNAWLEAESQGVKTQGYTPRPQDLAALEKLREERATNRVQSVDERRREQPKHDRNIVAPRHDLNKNQAQMYTEAKMSETRHMEALKKVPGMAEKSIEELSKLAYFRGLVEEKYKTSPQAERDDALSRFDKIAPDPKTLHDLDKTRTVEVKEKTVERTIETHEQSL